MRVYGLISRSPDYWSVRNKTNANLDLFVDGTLAGSINANATAFHITQQNKPLYIGNTKWDDFVSTVVNLKDFTSKKGISVTKKSPNDVVYVAYYESGIVNIRGYAYTPTSGIQNTAILTIPTVHAPKDCGIYTSGGLSGNGSDMTGYGITSLSTDGKLNIRYSTGVGFVFFNFCYTI